MSIISIHCLSFQRRCVEITPASSMLKHLSVLREAASQSRVPLGCSGGRSSSAGTHVKKKTFSFKPEATELRVEDTASCTKREVLWFLLQLCWWSSHSWTSLTRAGTGVAWRELSYLIHTGSLTSELQTVSFYSESLSPVYIVMLERLLCIWKINFWTWF